MTYNKDDVIVLTDNRKFTIISLLNIDEYNFLYLKSNDTMEYTIVKVINDKIYNLNNREFSMIISNMLLRGEY